MISDIRRIPFDKIIFILFFMIKDNSVYVF